MKKLLMTAGAAVLALTTAASAATLTIDPRGNSIDSTTAAGGNAALNSGNPFGFGSTIAGFYESQIVASGFGANSKVLVEVMGYEAAFMNTFSAGGTSFTSPGQPLQFSATPLASWTVDASSGLDFTFSTLPTGHSVDNGDPNLRNQGAVDFFAHDSGDGYIWLFMDDGGAGLDDNHDDLVVRLSAVPLPAGALLLLSGLGALALRRRKS